MGFNERNKLSKESKPSTHLAEKINYKLFCSSNEPIFKRKIKLRLTI